MAAETPLLPEARRSRRARVVGVRVDPVSPAEAVRRVIAWAQQGEGRYVCVANVHLVLEARVVPSVRAAPGSADHIEEDTSSGSLASRGHGAQVREQEERHVQSVAFRDAMRDEAARDGVGT